MKRYVAKREGRHYRLEPLRIARQAAKDVRLRVYQGETLETMAADLISYCKAIGITKREAVAEFMDIWDRVLRPDDPPYTNSLSR